MKKPKDGDCLLIIDHTETDRVRVTWGTSMCNGKSTKGLWITRERRHDILKQEPPAWQSVQTVWLRDSDLVSVNDLFGNLLGLFEKAAVAKAKGMKEE